MIIDSTLNSTYIDTLIGVHGSCKAQTGSLLNFPIASASNEAYFVSIKDALVFASTGTNLLQASFTVEYTKN